MFVLEAKQNILLQKHIFKKFIFIKHTILKLNYTKKKTIFPENSSKSYFLIFPCAARNNVLQFKRSGKLL